MKKEEKKMNIANCVSHLFKLSLILIFFIVETRVRSKKQVKPKIPDYSSISSYNEPTNNVPVLKAENAESEKKVICVIGVLVQRSTT